MDQYLYIPFLVGWTSIYQLFWGSPGVQGFDPSPSMTGSAQNPKICRDPFEPRTNERRSWTRWSKSWEKSSSSVVLMACDGPCTDRARTVRTTLRWWFIWFKLVQTYLGLPALQIQYNSTNYNLYSCFFSLSFQFGLFLGLSVILSLGASLNFGLDLDPGSLSIGWCCFPFWGNCFA